MERMQKEIENLEHHKHSFIGTVRNFKLAHLNNKRLLTLKEVV